MTDLSDVYHDMAMEVGKFVIANPDLPKADRESLIDYQSKLQDLSYDFIDVKVKGILDDANTSLAKVKAAIQDAKVVAKQIATTAKVLQVAAATAALGFAIFTGVTTGSFGGITGALSDLIKVASTPVKTE